MILGTKARYAVMAMVELANRNSSAPVPLSELAGKQEITLPYLEQIFSKLRKCNLVKSVLGPGGGYVLARPSGEIRISEIVEAAEESLKITRCSNETDGGCMSDKSHCVTHKLWDGLGMQIHNYLFSISLADVCNGTFQ